MIVNTSNLRHEDCWLQLAEDIRGKSSNGVYFVPAAGNYGDALINIGARQFFSSYSIAFTELNRKKLIEEDLTTSGLDKSRLVILGGGGAYCKNFSSTYHLANKVSSYFRSVLILPSTYELPMIDSDNVTYYARDKFGSFNNIKVSRFCHDMAFFIELNFMAPSLENRIWRLFALRADREGHRLNERVEANFDVSKTGDASYTNPIPFFQLISNFKVIFTDRMHIAIAASMLGLPCSLIVGNYFKSRDVYKSSIELNYPETRLLEVDQFLQKTRL